MVTASDQTVTSKRRGRPKGSGAGLEVQFFTRLPTPLAERIDRVVAERGTDRSTIVREMLTAHIKEQEHPREPTVTAVGSGTLPGGIDCYKGDDGERYLSQRGIVRAIRTHENPGKTTGGEDGNLAPYLDRLPNASKQLTTGGEVHLRIPLEAGGYRVAIGRPARFLISFCSAYIEAHAAGTLHHTHVALAHRAGALLTAFALKGIEAMVDEACAVPVRAPAAPMSPPDMRAIDMQAFVDAVAAQLGARPDFVDAVAAQLKADVRVTVRSESSPVKDATVENVLAALKKPTKFYESELKLLTCLIGLADPKTGTVTGQSKPSLTKAAGANADHILKRFERMGIITKKETPKYHDPKAYTLHFDAILRVAKLQRSGHEVPDS